MKTWQLQSEEQWAEIAQELLPLWKAGHLVALRGELGVGKTSFVRAVLRSLGYEEPVRSPSYPLMIEYELPHIRIAHMDAFRLDPRHERPWSLASLQESLSFMEWPERCGLPLESFDFELHIKVLPESEVREAHWKSLKASG